jgi:hypothetical protein
LKVSSVTFFLNQSGVRELRYLSLSRSSLHSLEV